MQATLVVHWLHGYTTMDNGTQCSDCLAARLRSHPCPAIDMECFTTGCLYNAHLYVYNIYLDKDDT